MGCKITSRINFLFISTIIIHNNDFFCFWNNYMGWSWKPISNTRSISYLKIAIFFYIINIFFILFDISCLFLSWSPRKSFDKIFRNSGSSSGSIKELIFIRRKDNIFSFCFKNILNQRVNVTSYIETIERLLQVNLSLMSICCNLFILENIFQFY